MDVVLIVQSGVRFLEKYFVCLKLFNCDKCTIDLLYESSTKLRYLGMICGTDVLPHLFVRVYRCVRVLLKRYWYVRQQAKCL